MRKTLLAVSLLAACGTGPAEKPANTRAAATALPTVTSSSSGALANRLFGAKQYASAQTPHPIGKYAKGCLAGGVQLPETGPTWQAMRLSRNRNWGHPATISFLKRLSAKAAKLGWAGLYIGDISQPRGGPMTSGHASHQLGLDADIWLYAPSRLNLSRSERESLSSTNVRSSNKRSVNGSWTATHMAVIRAAAKDPVVDRIFITAPAKIWMCKNAGSDRKWLQKVRPLYGHNTHFHVRLKCPKDASNCVTQTPSVSALSNGGDGCDASLNWWVTDYLKPAPPADPNKPKPPRKRGARDFTMADLPRQCQNVLSAR